MVFATSNGKPDPSLERIDALAATELALGVDRLELATKLTLVATAVIGGLDERASTRHVARKLRQLADRLEVL